NKQSLNRTISFYILRYPVPHHAKWLVYAPDYRATVAHYHQILNQVCQQNQSHATNQTSGYPVLLHTMDTQESSSYLFALQSNAIFCLHLLLTARMLYYVDPSLIEAYTSSSPTLHFSIVKMK